MGLARYLYLLLLCQNCYILNWYFLLETTHDIVMLDHNVFCITQKRNSNIFFLNVTNVGTMYFVSEIINDYNYTEPMW